MTFETLFPNTETMDAMENSYQAFLTALQQSDMLTVGNIKPAKKCHWQMFYGANRDRAPLNQNGLYLFGYGNTVIYVGKTGGGQTFTSRFENRYMGREQLSRSAVISSGRAVPQFLIAHNFEVDIQENGWEVLQQRFSEMYDATTRNFNGNPPVRIRHAEALANAGMNRVWFLLLPVEKEADISENEKKLISTVAKSSPELLNVHHKNYNW